MEKASRFLKEIMTDSLRQRGFIYHTLFTKWHEIIGDDISTKVTPVRMKFPRRRDGATLTVRIKSALWPEMQLRMETVRDRINQFYGRLAVKTIKFDICHELEPLESVEKMDIEEKEKQGFDSKIRKVGSDTCQDFHIRASDPELTELLQSLQRNWFYRSQK